MKTVIFCGDPSSGCEAIYRSVVAMGLAQPVASGRGGMLPGELQEKLLKLSDVDTSGEWSAPHNPGTLWQELAADLFLANVDAKQWGWCDTSYAPILPFWKSFDPKICFVLTYAPPEYALAGVLRADGFDPSMAAKNWIRFNQALLRFYMSNQARCLLINTRSPRFSGAHFTRLLKERFELDLPAEKWIQPPQTDKALEALLARQVLADSADVADICHSLESMADIPYGDEAGTADTTAALQQLRQHELQVLDLHRRLARQEQEARQQQEILLIQLRDSQNQLNHYTKQAADTNAALQQLRQHELQEQDLHSRLARQEQESRQQQEILLAQLRESQDELDRYTARIEEFLGSKTASPSAADVSAAIEHVFDARRGFAGDNWHAPEEDGRWAGPLPISTARLPRLAPGRYSVNLDVAGAMAPDILEGTRCYVNGDEISLDGAWAGCPAVLYGEFMVPESDDRGRMELQLQFPRTESPAEQGLDGDDRRKLAIRLRSIAIRAIEIPA